MHASARLALTLACCLVIAACSSKDEGKKSSLVAVKVNDDELSVPQVNAQLQRLQGVAADRREEARKQVVEGLVDQQLFMQQAREMKLDRDPEVLAATEASRAQILAQAYVQKAVLAKARPTADEISKYYADHPELFSQRRVFRVQEVATDFPPARQAELEQAVARSKTMADVVDWLTRQQSKAAVNGTVRGAEMLPMEALPKIQAMKDGDMLVLGGAKSVSVLQVMASQARPLDEKQATPYIEQYLLASRRDSLVRDEAERLRKEAKIEYVGEFVKLASTGATGPAADPAPATPAASKPAVDKGLSGLR